MTDETKEYESLKQNLETRIWENMNAKNKNEDLEKIFYAERHSLRKTEHNHALRKQGRSVKRDEQEDNMSEFEKETGRRGMI
jgi:hypothetical protein